MSGVSGVTNQLNSANPCPSCDCPDLTSRLDSIEGKNRQQDTQLANLDGKSDLVKNVIDAQKAIIEGEINAVRTAAEGAANAAKNVAEGIGNEVKALVGLIPRPPDNRGQIEEIDRVAHQALDIAQRAYGEIVKVQQVLPIIDRTATNAQNTADRAIDLATRASAVADRAADVALDDARRIEDLEIQVRSLQDGRNPIGSTDAELVALQVQIAALQAEIAGLATVVGTHETRINGLILAVGFLQGQNIGILANITGLLSWVGALEPSLAQLWQAFLAQIGKSRIGQPGEKGDKGDKGDPGLPGAKGDRGEPGIN